MKKSQIIGVVVLVFLLGISAYFSLGEFFSGLNFSGKVISSIPDLEDLEVDSVQATTNYNINAISSKTYIYAGSLLATKMENEDSTLYYIQDHLGSNKEVVNGQIVEQENDFYAFGEEKLKTGDSDNDYLYTGKEKDSETGLYYYGARYYSPEVGRFMAADALTGSIENPLSMNRYAYVMNNPLRFIDPTGNAAGKSENLFPGTFQKDSPIVSSGSKGFSIWRSTEGGFSISGKTGGSITHVQTYLFSPEAPDSKAYQWSSKIHFDPPKSQHGIEGAHVHQKKGPVVSFGDYMEHLDQVEKKVVEEGTDAAESLLKKGVKIVGKGLKFVPLIGIGVGLTSATANAAEGDYVHTAVDVAGIIPVVGDIIEGVVALGEAAADMEMNTAPGSPIMVDPVNTVSADIQRQTHGGEPEK